MRESKLISYLISNIQHIRLKGIYESFDSWDLFECFKKKMF